jgi:NitT/TauT family transport system ATP-binding protein
MQPEAAGTTAGRQLDGPAVPALSLRGVGKCFASRAGTAVALQGIDLTVERGRFVTVIGPSGCGKSTLLRIVAGLVRADEGQVAIFGDTPDVACADKQVGFVPQRPALLPWRTVLDNVRLPLQVNKAASARQTLSREPEEILRAVGLADVLDRHPGELSGGMQQRVAIARAFAFEPSILLMDEPFSSLDEMTREVLRAELLGLWQGQQATVLFVTHSVAEAIVLSDAVVVMAGPPGRIQAVLPVGLERPRRDLVELTDDYRELEREVRLQLRGAWASRPDGT